ncbi:hypothetical protein XENOCAPTIV_026607 [Xenoophorus captivus]|uniref:Uncharacterized protein n=1 Tax=Xenoophorus captivus TaxID=1517983 RepID=A0ABV0S9B6_9TELE
MLRKAEMERGALDVKLKHARNQVDVEIRRRQKAEADCEMLVWSVNANLCFMVFLQAAFNFLHLRFKYTGSIISSPEKISCAMCVLDYYVTQYVLCVVELGFFQHQDGTTQETRKKGMFCYAFLFY